MVAFGIEELNEAVSAGQLTPDHVEWTNPFGSWYFGP
jgi:hypothetical protein